MKTEPEVIIIALCLMFPLGIHLFYKDWLDNPKTWNILMKISIGLALIGICLTSLGIGKKNFLLFLMHPMMSFGVYRFLFITFENKFNRIPKDTAFDWSKGLFYDRLFNIGFGILGIILPAVLIGVLIEMLI